MGRLHGIGCISSRWPPVVAWRGAWCLNIPKLWSQVPHFLLTLISASSLSTSSLVRLMCVSPLMRAAYLRATMSSQPMRRGRPVVVPYSAPISRSSSASCKVGPKCKENG